jgi:hypothetical protein
MTRRAGEPDSRTIDGRLFNETRDALIAHVGGAPNATQQILIKQACHLQVHIAAMERQFTETAVQSPDSVKIYLAYTAALARLMRSADLKAAKPARPAKDAP